MRQLTTSAINWAYTQPSKINDQIYSTIVENSEYSEIKVIWIFTVDEMNKAIPPAK